MLLQKKKKKKKMVGAVWESLWEESAATVKEILLQHHKELVKQREEIEHVGCRSRRECCRLAMDLPVP
jgi:hypothetical protein